MGTMYRRAANQVLKNLLKCYCERDGDALGLNA